MGKPAARLGDMHTCPMVTPGTPPIPHVGGPITGPGCPTVLIGGLPAAVMGDMCVCVGPPDTIVLGSTGVLIGGKPAARMGDQCAHGGAIVIGCPTVLIGETSSGGSSSSAGAEKNKQAKSENKKQAGAEKNKQAGAEKDKQAKSEEKKQAKSENKKQAKSEEKKQAKAEKKKNKQQKSKSKGWSKKFAANKEVYEKYIDNAAAKYSESIGLPASEVAKTLKTMMYIESKGDARAVSSTDCRGLFQFAKKTGQAMGLVSKDGDLKEFDNRFDPQANTDAAARLLADSAKQLKNRGIPVTSANLYVIHQQGAGVGGKLLKAKLDNTVADLSISEKERKSLDLNGGKDKSPEEFINMWLDKYEKNDGIVHELDKPPVDSDKVDYTPLT